MSNSRTPMPQALTQHPPAAILTDNGLERISKRAHPPSLTIVPYSSLWPTQYTKIANRILAALGPRALSIAHVGSTSIPGMPAKAIIDIDLVVADPADEDAYVSALVGKGWEGTGTGRGCSDVVDDDDNAEGGRGAGLQFLLREPGWHQHRFFICDDHDDDDDRPLAAHVHVWGPGCPEVMRHQLFKNWLLTVSWLFFLSIPFGRDDEQEPERNLHNIGSSGMGRLRTLGTCTADNAHVGAEQHPEDFETYASVKRECSAASKESGESMAQYNLRKEPVIHAILDRAFKAQGLLE